MNYANSEYHAVDHSLRTARGEVGKLDHPRSPSTEIIIVDCKSSAHHRVLGFIGRTRQLLRILYPSVPKLRTTRVSRGTSPEECARAVSILGVEGYKSSYQAISPSINLSCVFSKRVKMDSDPAASIDNKAIIDLFDSL